MAASALFPSSLASEMPVGCAKVSTERGRRGSGAIASPTGIEGGVSGRGAEVAVIEIL